MSPHSETDRDQLVIDTLRFLAVDMVEAAQSGHPGAPMGQAPMAWALWRRFLRFDPTAPAWADRDRFVLSAGHASALIYGLLHLAGYDLPMAELKRFRQLGSRTPGHPENFLTAGVETTTGPLGQGFGNAVGMALGREMAAARFNRPGHELFTWRTWVIASDGDLMEGVSAETASLAGHLRLGSLNVLYDDNEISIDGATDLAFSEDVTERFEAVGWHVQQVADGNDLAALDAAIAAAAAETSRPSLIRVRTVIGFGSPGKAGTAAAHGAPLGAAEVEATKRAMGWPLEPTFRVPDEAREAFAAAAARGTEARREWDRRLAAYRDAHPELAAELERRLAGRLPEGWAEALPRFETGKAVATRKASGKVLNAVAEALPELVGGSADLAESNNTLIEGSGDVSAGDRSGRNLRFGVREHGMGSILNGLALTRLFRPYGATFLIFSDYMRPPVRLAALMGLPVTYVFTHDSIFLGEDGPTHQPISQLVSLRSIPNLTVIRPADANETAAAWKVALETPVGPTALSLTRQNLPTLAGTAERAVEGVARGAYVLRDTDRSPDLLLLATGSEVQLAVAAAERLAEEGVAARVISFPSWERFAAQPAAYRETVLPPAVRRRLAIEAGSPLGWHRWVGDGGDVLAMEGFGASAPWQELAERFGFTVDEVVGRARTLLT